MITENLQKVRAGIAAAETECNRVPGSVELIAVSKTYPVDAVMTAYQAGQRAFGENRIQELESKVPLLPGDIEWHLIGHLQSNKAAKAVALAKWIHAVDSIPLIERLNRLAEEQHKQPNILLEVNISGELSKEGFCPEEVSGAVRAALASPSLLLCGLMTVAPFDAESGELRHIFNTLKSLRDWLETEFSIRLPHLSMGMSGDFREAIAEGATQVRIGSAIFGSRE